MFRAVAFTVLALFSSFAFAQDSNQMADSGSGSASTVQVVYVINGSTLTTYNVNPKTLQATSVGKLTLPESIYPGLVTSPTGEFLYYIAFENINQQDEKLYVYQTDASGVPGSKPVQTLTATGLGGIVIDPKGNFLYTEVAGAQSSETTTYTINRYVMNPSTGKLSDPVVEAKYKLDSYEGGEFCGLGIIGVNSAGTELYDGISCTYPQGGASATYNERSIDASTGALGPDVQIYSWNNDGNQSGQNVYFVKNFLFDFVSNNGGSDENLVNIYPIQANVTKPTISCGTSMYAPCGDFISARAHPSAEYVFLTDPTSVTDIGKVNLSTKKIVETSSIPYEVQEFSPDGTIAYGVNDVNGALDIEIYGFSVATGDVTRGGTISVPSDLDSWWAAERY